VGRLWNFIHTFKLEVFIINALFHSFYLSFRNLSNTLSELFERIDKWRGVSNHSPDTLPPLLLILSTSGLQDHNSDTKCCDLRWRLIQRFECCEFFSIYNFKCFFSLEDLRFSVLKDLVCFSLLSFNLCDFYVQLFLFGNCSSLIFFHINLDDLNFC